MLPRGSAGGPAPGRDHCAAPTGDIRQNASIEQPWNSIELTVATPENVRVVMTAAKPFKRNSHTVRKMRESGFDLPRG